MKKLIFLLALISIASQAQQKTSFLVHPYLQDAEPNSIKILWETNQGEESRVEWGQTPRLGKRATGKFFAVNYGSSRIHEVQLTGLKRFTEYYYRVRTNDAVSDIFQFKTPPFAQDNESFSLLAMSDMQLDEQQPAKFSEIVNEGIIPYLGQNGKKLSENLALVMVPGDLVVTGSIYEQWQEHFFGPAQALFSHVPVYPVLGNHEQNSLFYFRYFSLPENGTPAYAEHWWYKDYGNVRIIGLDSNKGYRDTDHQLSWLKKVLEETANKAAIDFVFAQLHHPHKSELWIPGETDFSGKVVKLLEEFTTKTGKPSVHFFGHTHGYSRGQSRDHKHLWVNVAAAGGAIDNWGEFEGRDYEEFTVTQDEYGFVIVTVSDEGDDPKMTLKRISRGNLQNPRDNELTDSITIFKNKRTPEAPKPLSPSDGATVKTTVALLKAAAFKSSHNGAFHDASHWQVSTDESFEKLVLDSWKQRENWYYKENRQKDDDLTDEPTRKLKKGAQYYWRVRFRDQNLNWSEWSPTTSFRTQ